jgi:hypothetical protein
VINGRDKLRREMVKQIRESDDVSEVARDDRPDELRRILDAVHSSPQIQTASSHETFSESACYKITFCLETTH